MARWREDGWSRAGQPLRNQDLWELLRRIFAEYQALGYVVEVRRVPAHVGIVGNERADKLAAGPIVIAFCQRTRGPKDVSKVWQTR